MVQVKKRNSLSSFGLRIIGRSNSIGKKSSRPPTTASNTRPRTYSSASQQEQQVIQPTMSSSYHPIGGSNSNLARGNSIKSNNYNKPPPVNTISDQSKHDQQQLEPITPKDNHTESFHDDLQEEKVVNEEEIPKSPTTASPSAVPEELEYANISAINIQQHPGAIHASSRNRAQAIINRLGAWQLILREVLIWLEQVGKINMQCSELYYHKVLPHVDWKDKNIKPETPMASLLGGFRSLTARVATTQQSAGNKLFKEYIPDLEALTKECKRKIQTLDQNRQFRMDELLKRAELTQKTIASLSKLCQAAVSSTGSGPLSQDPWVTNLHVLRHLQREVQEDNRLRTTMIDIQHQSALFEKRVIHTLKKTMQFCYDHYGNIATSRETARVQRMIEKMDTEREWQQFLNSEARDLVVDALNPSRNYLHINYNNKFHPAVMTLHKGFLGRRTGVRKQYTTRYFVLTQCGFLHQFHENDKVNPELTIFIPKSTIVPSVDISHLANTSGFGGGNNSGGDYTFEIRRGGSGALQRDKVYVLRANSREELIAWCRLLVDIATRRTNGPQPVTWKKIQRKSTAILSDEDPTLGEGEIKVDTTNKTAAVHRSISNASSKYTKIQSPPPLSPVITSPTPPTPEQEALSRATKRITSIIDDYNVDQLKKAQQDENSDSKEDNDIDISPILPPTKAPITDTENGPIKDKGKGRSNEEIITLEPIMYPTFEEQEMQQTRYYRTDSEEKGIYISKEQQSATKKDLKTMTIQTTSENNSVPMEEEDQKTPTKESMPIISHHHAMTTDTSTIAAGSVEQQHDKTQQVAVVDNTIVEKKDDIPDQLQQTSTLMTSFVSYLPQLTAFSPSTQEDEGEPLQQKKKDESTISIASSHQTFESFPARRSSEDIRNTTK